MRLDDFEPIARDRMEPAAFDYVAGGAGDEQSLAENLTAWRRYWLRPRVLTDSAALDPSTTFLGRTVRLPVAIAPMACHALADPAAETATARAAAKAGVPFTLSTMSSSSIEEIARSAPEGDRWFQLYMFADRRVSRALAERAAEAGYQSIVLTVDVPVRGQRERERKHPPLVVPFGNFAGSFEVDASGPVAPSLYGDAGDHGHGSFRWDDIERIRAWTGLNVVVKGILAAEDARLAVDHGVDGIVVSNHGGRQLDRAVAAIDVLEEIVAAVEGRAEIWVDGGVRRGIDVVVALALGARGVLIGRPIFWALAAGGESGVDRALAILEKEVKTGLALLGASGVAQIERGHVRHEDDR